MPEEPNRREQIMEAAFEEFAAKGFKGATIKSIAETAKVQSPALIYHYFPDQSGPTSRRAPGGERPTSTARSNSAGSGPMTLALAPEPSSGC